MIYGITAMESQHYRNEGKCSLCGFVVERPKRSNTNKVVRAVLFCVCMIVLIWVYANLAEAANAEGIETTCESTSLYDHELRHCVLL